jgi:hypothetical protein
MKKHIIIYHPLGEKQFATLYLDDTIEIVEDIRIENGMAVIYTQEDDNPVIWTYCMPFFLDQW